MKAFSNERSAADVTVGLPSSRTQTTARPLCQRPFVKLYVLASGDCVLCNVDWRRSILLGRISDGADGQIANIWRSPRYHELRLDTFVSALRTDTSASAATIRRSIEAD